PLWCGCRKLFAAAAVADRHQLLRLRLQGAAVAAAGSVPRAIGLRGHAARGPQEVAAGVVAEGVGRPHLVVQEALSIGRAGAAGSAHDVALLAGGALGEAAIDIDDK